MAKVRVTEEVREKLNLLRGVMLKKSVNEVIISLMISREYNDAFFERQRERQANGGH